MPVDLGVPLWEAFRCRLVSSLGASSQMVRAPEAGCLEEEDT